MADEKDKIASMQAKLDAMEKELLAREQALKEREAAIAAAEDLGATKSVRPMERVTIGNGYKFEVSPIKADTKLPTKTIECCDESEALRWYVATTDSPAKPGKQVDPVANPLQVKCVDPRRERDLKQARYVAVLRAKRERGNELTAEESAMVDEADAKIGVIS